MASVVNYLKYKYFKYVFEIHTEYFVFEINYKSILYFWSEVKIFWQKYFKYDFQKYFVFNTLKKVSFATVVMVIVMWRYTPVWINGVLVLIFFIY